jgi:hypothetical protein
MRMSNDEIEAYVDLWLSMKPYVNPKDKIEACEKFLSVINETVIELDEVADEWVGYDTSIDKVIRDNYIEHAGSDDDYNEDDDVWD